MKGQNLRLLINGKCVAAARECSWHLGLQLEDKSTKDAVGDFAEQEVTAKNWDASASALYVNNAELILLNHSYGDHGGKSFYEPVFPSVPGVRYIFVSLDGEPLHAYIAKQDYTVVAEGEGLHVSIESNFTGSLHIGLDDEEDWSRVRIFRVPADNACDLESLFAAFDKELPVDVKLATTEGAKNREVDDDVLLSTGIITDLQLVSADRQLVTFTIQIQGSSEIE